MILGVSRKELIVKENISQAKTGYKKYYSLKKNIIHLILIKSSNFLKIN